MEAFFRLLDLLDSISAAETLAADEYRVRRFDDLLCSGWIGRGATASVAFVLPSDLTGESRPPAVELPSFRARHRVRVLLNKGDSAGAEYKTASVIECLLEDRPSIELFVRVVGSVLDSTESEDSAQAIGQAIDKLLDLFREYSYATESEILGLWGELLVLSVATDTSYMASCWRVSEFSRFDFGNQQERVEVKATTSRQRIHELSFDQVSPSPGVEVAFVSMLTERVASGKSIGALWLDVLRKAPEMQSKIDGTCLSTLGRDWQKAQEICFDESLALSSLRVYSVRDIPRIDRLPDGVLQARFKSDFHGCEELSFSKVSNQGLIGQVLESASALA